MAPPRPFTVDIPADALADLSTRLDATRWIDDIFDGNEAYGAPVPFARALCDHWQNRYDWRGLEARINRQPQILSDIDGLTIHAIHRRSERGDAVPLILLHGWPSSFLEFLDICDALADPPAGQPAFHVIVPSLPGYGFSTTRKGVAPQHVAGMFATLMERLGYPRYLVQGGNWGAVIGTEMARLFPDRLIGLHLNSINGSPPPDPGSVLLTPAEERWVAEQKPPGTYPHFVMYTQMPVSIAHALNDLPAGLAAWIGLWLRDWADRDQPDNPGLSLDWMVGTIALYWLTGSIATSSLLYYEMVRNLPPERFVTVPTAVCLPGKELVKIPRGWAERHFNILRWSEFDRGGHFAAIEVAEPFVQDIRDFVAALAADRASDTPA